VSCCSEPGELFIFPSAEGGSEFPSEELDFELRPISSFDLSLAGRDEETAHGLPRPWVAQVPEDEVEKRAEELSERPGIAVACPNWRLSLASPDLGATVGVLDHEEVQSFLDRSGIALPAPGAGAGVHIAIIDSGIRRGAVSPLQLRRPQIDFAVRGHAVRSLEIDEYGHGSLVGALINRMAPSAHISSIRCFRRRGAVLSDVVYSLLYLRLLRWPVHIVNLSLSVDAAVEVCRRCGLEGLGSGDAREKLSRIIAELGNALHPCPLFVAAAGVKHRLASPAQVSEVVAVASATEVNPPMVERSYAQEEELVLAPGGSRAEPIDPSNRGFFGSSFATAVASGALAQDRHALEAVLHVPWSQRPEAQRRLVEGRADRGFEGYEVDRHGLGLIR
jgi:hypothetical protein